jgi:ferredoxin
MARIVVDTVKCVGLGVCESLADQVFELNDAGDLVLLTGDVVAPADLDAVRAAVAGCPTEALSIVEV